MTVRNFEDPRIKVVVKSADEIVNNSAVLQNDNDLLLAVGANSVWWFEFFVIHTTDSTRDLTLAVTGPAGSTIVWGHPASTTAPNKVGGSDIDVVSGSGAGRNYRIWGVAAIGSTAGNIQLQWAQTVAGAVDTTVKENSIGLFTRIA